MLMMLWIIVLLGELMILMWCGWVGSGCLCLLVNRFLLVSFFFNVLKVRCRVLLLVGLMVLVINW